MFKKTIVSALSLFVLFGCSLDDSTKITQEKFIDKNVFFKIEPFVGCNEYIKIDFKNDSNSRNYLLNKYFTSFDCDVDSGAFSHPMYLNISNDFKVEINYNFKTETLNVVSYDENIIYLEKSKDEVEEKLVNISKTIIDDLRIFLEKKEKERIEKENKLKEYR